MNEKLKELLNLLNKNGFEPRHQDTINTDLKYGRTRIEIFYTNQFTIVWHPEENKLQLETTFSNQTITEKYMKELNWLHERVMFYNI